MEGTLISYLNNKIKEIKAECEVLGSSKCHRPQLHEFVSYRPQVREFVSSGNCNPSLENTLIDKKHELEAYMYIRLKISNKKDIDDIEVCLHRSILTRVQAMEINNRQMLVELQVFGRVYDLVEKGVLI
jgi:hypothetical protein